MNSITRIIIILILLLNLPACGGGRDEDEEELRHTPHVDCAKNPELCK